MPTGHTALKKTFLTAAALLIAATLSLCHDPAASAQPVGVYSDTTAHNLVYGAKLRANVEEWCDSIYAGRATGTRGAVETTYRLVTKFRDMKLLALGAAGYTRSFYANADSTVVGHNVVGMVPGSVKTPVEEYIIVTAHFDGIGTLGGNLYPGADSNASGLTALTTLAEMFSSMKILGRMYGASVVFAALDGSRHSMAGAYALRDDIEKGRIRDPLTGRHITADKVRLVVNIDQIGASLSPLASGREDYLIMLGSASLPKDRRDLLSLCNRTYGTGLELSDTYYGSENFTRLFYTLSDQRPFVENGFPAVMFTSGITMKTNKTSDIPSTLNYPVLRRRILLIYHFLDRMTLPL